MVIHIAAIAAGAVAWELIRPSKKTVRQGTSELLNGYYDDTDSDGNRYYG
jgi:hypothetical protein